MHKSGYAHPRSNRPNFLNMESSTSPPQMNHAGALFTNAYHQESDTHSPTFSLYHNENNRISPTDDENSDYMSMSPKRSSPNSSKYAASAGSVVTRTFDSGENSFLNGESVYTDMSGEGVYADMSGGRNNASDKNNFISPTFDSSKTQRRRYQSTKVSSSSGMTTSPKAMTLSPVTNKSRFDMFAAADSRRGKQHTPTQYTATSFREGTHDKNDFNDYVDIGTSTPKFSPSKQQATDSLPPIHNIQRTQRSVKRNKDMPVDLHEVRPPTAAGIAARKYLHEKSSSFSTNQRVHRENIEIRRCASVEVVRSASRASKKGAVRSRISSNNLQNSLKNSRQTRELNKEQSRSAVQLGDIGTHRRIKNKSLTMNNLFVQENDDKAEIFLEENKFPKEVDKRQDGSQIIKYIAETKRSQSLDRNYLEWLRKTTPYVQRAAVSTSSGRTDSDTSAGDMITSNDDYSLTDDDAFAAYVEKNSRMQTSSTPKKSKTKFRSLFKKSSK